jgi:hypothetical protein
MDQSLAADYRDDPEWQAAYARYLEPDTDNRDERLFIRIEAARELRDIEGRYESRG